jgi:predicted RNase H-like HicB family nuclease
MHDSRAAFLPIVLERNEDGYLASVPGVSGAFAEGDSVEEALFNCVDVVKMIMAYRLERGESLDLNEVEIAPDTRLAVSMPVGIL